METTENNNPLMQELYDGYIEYIKNTYGDDDDGDGDCGETETKKTLQECQSIVIEWIRPLCNVDDTTTQLILEGIYILTYDRIVGGNFSSKDPESPQTREWQKPAFAFLKNHGLVRY